MTMNERRLHGRRRTFKGGKLIFNKGLSVLDCIIRDLSDDGARLELTTTTTIPDQFDDHHRTRPDQAFLQNSLYASTSAFAAALLATFAIWYRRERTLSINTIVTRRRELFYWAAILCTFALGPRPAISRPKPWDWVSNWASWFSAP